MNHITKRLEQAIDAVRTMTPEQQDLLALELLAHARALSLPPVKLTAHERAELAAARHGCAFRTLSEGEPE